MRGGTVGWMAGSMVGCIAGLVPGSLAAGPACAQTTALATLSASAPATVTATTTTVAAPAPGTDEPQPHLKPAVVTENALLRQLRDEGVAYENGEGVPRDGARAAQLYCQAARLGDAESQYNLAWMYANGRGVERSDSTAAFFFHAAAEQGLAAAQRMLSRVGGPSSELPECMRVVPKAEVLAAVARSAPAAAPDEVRSSGPRHIVELVKTIAPEFKVDPQLALAFIKTESNFDVMALSPKNAQGLMQLIPETAARFNVKRPYDPAQNIRGGLAYIRYLLAYYQGDVALVAAAYNAGEGAVNRYRGIPPYVETLGYVSKILRSAGMITHPFDQSVAEPSPQLPLMRDLVRRVQ